MFTPRTKDLNSALGVHSNLDNRIKVLYSALGVHSNLDSRIKVLYSALGVHSNLEKRMRSNLLRFFGTTFRCRNSRFNVRIVVETGFLILKHKHKVKLNFKRNKQINLSSVILVDFGSPDYYFNLKFKNSKTDILICPDLRYFDLSGPQIFWFDRTSNILICPDLRYFDLSGPQIFWFDRTSNILICPNLRYFDLSGPLIFWFVRTSNICTYSIYLVSGG